MAAVACIGQFLLLLAGPLARDDQHFAWTLKSISSQLAVEVVSRTLEESLLRLVGILHVHVRWGLLGASEATYMSQYYLM